MRIREHGKVQKSLWYLGHEDSGVYVLEGSNESMVISGGMRYIAPAVIQQLKAFDIDRERIKKILILHAHFDHVGIVPFLKRTLPGLDIYASARAWEIIRMPKAIDTINAFSRSVTERMGLVETCSGYDLEWRDDVSGKTVSEGDQIDLGDMEVRIFETPGHSSCSISAYVPRLKALFPSDGGGIPYRETIITSGNSNYTRFQESLEKLKELEVEYLCADHYGYVTGEEARNFISRGIALAREHRSEIEEIYGRTRDINKTAKALTESFYTEYPDYILTPEIYEAVYGQIVKHIAKVMEGNP